MTLQELIDNIKSAVTEQFGTDIQTEMFPSKYFNPNVVTISPEGLKSPRAPKYCATPLGASQLVAAINAASFSAKCTSIQLANAVVYTGLLAGWADSELVPWLLFDNGSIINAGTLLDYCNHGYPEKIVFANIDSEIFGDRG